MFEPTDRRQLAARSGCRHHCRQFFGSDLFPGKAFQPAVQIVEGLLEVRESHVVGPSRIDFVFLQKPSIDMWVSEMLGKTPEP